MLHTQTRCKDANLCMCVGLPLDKKTVENQGWAAGRCGPPGLWVVMDQELLGKSLLVDRRDLMSIGSGPGGEGVL